MSQLRMSQIGVSVVIPVWNQWQFTKACLDSLRPTVGVRDEIIVVDNGSEDQTPTGLKHFPGIKVITNEANLGFAVACNQGAAAATGDVVVFLNNDTLVTSRWLDDLVSPFEDETVAATGPRSNMVSGPQIVENIDYTFGSVPELRKFAKKWQNEHKGQTSETERLVGFCLAVRHSAFEAIDGFDETFEIGGAEDDDLGLRLIANGGRLLITHGSFVHHHGHATFDGNGLDWFAIQEKNLDRFAAKHGSARSPRRESGAPLLSACMIVKDEEELLSKCLSSLSGLVDEVVIYDTGSTDGTVQLARDAGATVIEGYWDDDFGRARNAALQACKGEWVIHIDADEVLECDPLALRQRLQQSPIAALQVEILNLSTDGRNNLTHRPCRIFKRALHHWSGRLHEQVVRRDGGSRTELGFENDARIIHSGYTAEQVTKKNKGERNIRIATAEGTEEEGRDPVDRLTNLARSYTFAERHEEALALYAQARSMATKLPVARRTLLRAGAQTCLTVGRPEEALAWADELATVCKSPDTANYLRGMALADLGRFEESLVALTDCDEMTDDDGVVFPVDTVHIRRAACYGALGQWEHAAAEFQLVADASDSQESVLALAVEAYWRIGRDVSSLLSRLDSTSINALLAQMKSIPVGAADAALEHLFQRPELRSNVLALAISIGPSLPCERALTWSQALRAVGLVDKCPLIAKAWDTSQHVNDRLTAAVLAKAAFDDDRADGALKFSATSVAPADFVACLYQISELAPSLLEKFVIAASTLPDRSFAMARALHELGAPDEGIAVLMHGLDKEGVNDVLATKAAEWLVSVGHEHEAAQLRSSVN